MKRLAITFCTTAFLFACTNDKSEKANTDDVKTSSATSTYHSEAKPDQWSPVDCTTAIKTMMKAGTPGKEHTMLAKSDGHWKAETTMWMSPDAAPMKSTAAVTNKMILNGRYQQSLFKGDMMGMPFGGTSTTGYDNAKKVWVSTWVDNMSTGILTMQGAWDEATKTAIYTGKMLCPANDKMCEMKQTVKMVDDNTQLMEMYGPDMKTGKKFKNMEMKLTRGK